ncbi:hypothetical protein CcaverHIS002_0112100 [Cutaneotrichosporon cavernicola]|uniref:protein-serine/threonine phosphatase n=1 Tax=Cutaneotrichosporon cavernicola TaxID=279322 RepID=A0AA48I615_9TREE|nr:uncharacterized protein CcaverHIS019_0111980 [Cutaneotrichosporon cavernicola]BEI80681.1 hypothetical protein CcaverHIS002_0112100 [Cutaneotrichosporon cavernicola]BEI88480.1 hypothetical protein CcaverHIS019_0111980 [Cutaneotrichosporon cavernicola]BEI96253.1 hypothetical protein CcaverHIS631_0112020 [Cutaneotrichosporon cavernicola]BEJ04024.1 hypothetical protein CcaverHIS641_0111990 [Cutaneotrichosporon cavernicola]
MPDAWAASPTPDGPTPCPVATVDTTSISPSASSSLTPDAQIADDNSQLTPEEAVSGPPLVPEEKLTFHMKWSGKTFELVLSSSDLLYDLRAQIEQLTDVPAEAQKILGLTKVKLSAQTEGSRLAAVGIQDGARFQMVGTPVHLRFKERVGPPPPDDGIDINYPARGSDGRFIAPAQDPRNQRKVAELVKKYPITIINEARPGKRLLVLDIDYTLVDTRPLIDGALPPIECARPGLHLFLERVYPHYDIVMWSQTHWRWLETKLVELGILGGDAAYKICFVADRTTMFPIFSERSGQMIKHEVKPLAYFWAQYPDWSAKNTIHIDDLGRNFALNPGEGLKIRAFKGAGTLEAEADRELEKLGGYLVDLAEMTEDFTTVDHSRWKKRRRRREGEGTGPQTARQGTNEGPTA